MWWEMSLSEYGHELIQHHGLKVFVTEFEPVDKADIFNAIQCTFDDFVSGDVFIVGITLASTLPVDTRCHTSKWFRVESWTFP